MAFKVFQGFLAFSIGFLTAYIPASEGGATEKMSILAGMLSGLSSLGALFKASPNLK